MVRLEIMVYRRDSLSCVSTSAILILALETGYLRMTNFSLSSLACAIIDPKLKWFWVYSLNYSCLQISLTM